MDAGATTDQPKPRADIGRGVLKRALQIGVQLLIQAAVLFLAAGRLDWKWAWNFMCLSLVGIFINSTIMLRVCPETIAERAETGEMKGWDKVIGGLWALMYFVLVLLVAGLDARFGWSGQLSLVLHIVGAAAFVLGYALFSWAMISNAYFTREVRIQRDRGHTVCTSGPYRFLRHPGYLGAIIQPLAVPLMLGSSWALIPGGLAALLMAIRTALEDQMLHAELDGYREYAARVRCRLLPGIW